MLIVAITITPLVVAATATTTAAGPAGRAVLAGKNGFSAAQGSVVYLVRHAETIGERAMDPSDPPLSDAGEARAVELARVLSAAGITSVHSTDLQRTMATAAAVAGPTGLAIEAYEPFDREAMAALIERLRTTPGRHLVVGHSNTTPAVVEALGGDPVSPIDENEYDRLYVVTIGGDGATVSTLLRYGAEPGRR